MGRIVALDYGLKRTGIAVTDPLQIIANSLEAIPTHTLVDFLKKYISGNQVDSIVIGLPVDLSGRDTDATQRIRAFIIQLKKIFPAIPIHEADERFTSKMAFSTMLESGINKKARRNKGNIDKISATIILQSYLESRRT